MEKIVVTDEMRRAVYAEECDYKGHNFDIVQSYGSQEPQYIMCGRCGRGWDVVAKREEELG